MVWLDKDYKLVKVLPFLTPRTPPLRISRIFSLGTHKIFGGFGITCEIFKCRVRVLVGQQLALYL